MLIHPRDALHGADAPLPPTLPVCDHYCGTPKTMQRSLQLQADMTREFGRCVFDVTLDCEDGAPVGEEAAHAARIADMALAAPPEARIAARLHPVGHPSFASDMATIAGRAGARLTHLMIPKVESAADIDAAERALLQAYAPGLPLHALIESPAAVQRAFEIAAHPRVQSISFGLMDFVSAHGGAIPSSAMGSEGQFTHPLVVRAKLEIAAAAHAAGKVPAHCVVTELSNTATLTHAARRAAHEFGYTRMWSIHPAQIRPILDAFAPDARLVREACDILLAAERAGWAPISFGSVLHDRASYRHHWLLLERERAAGHNLPPEVAHWFP